MSSAVYICGVADRCDKHNRVLHDYPCNLCHEQWQARHPNTVEAIARFAAGKGSLAAIRKAKEQDQIAITFDH